MGNLTNKTVIVTGAARGVGLAIARRFVDAGAQVMMADCDEEALEAERRVLSTQDAPVHAFGGDLRERLTIANLISATVEAFDRIDILVNAARMVEAADPMEMEAELFEGLLNQNVLANLALSRAVARRMIADGVEREARTIGAIVNVTSIAARRTLPELLAYSVSCAALDQLTRSLAVALADNRIRVNAVALGSVMSSSLKDALRDRDGLRSAMTSATPLGRIAEAGEAAEAALFLASDSADFITGQILAVDGGRTLVDPLDIPAH